MKTWQLFGVMAAAFGALALAASSKPKAATVSREKILGLPQTRNMGFEVNPTTGVQTITYNGKSWFGYGMPPDLETARGFMRELRAQFALRQMALPDDALAVTDKYSKGLFGLPAWTVAAGVNPDTATLEQLQQRSTGLQVDEFGRVKPGEYGTGGSVFDTFTRLLENPLFGATLRIAIVAFGGPAGMAALGAYSLWEQRGKELTASNFLVMAGRAAAVSQCGEACGMAFDFGAGIAQGQDIDEAAEDALWKQLTPEQRAYYEQGKQLVNEVA